MSLTGEASAVDSMFMLMAQDMGLHLVIENFQDDLHVAAQTAEQLRNALSPLDSAAEPWPPMRVGRVA